MLKYLALAIGSLAIGALVFSLVACGSSPDYGPLAIFRTDGGLDARGGIGPIDIGSDCVTLINEIGQKLLLIWTQQEPGGEVAWNEEEREITFRSQGDSPVTIRHGDVITVGGADLVGDRLRERDLDWLALPHESCTGEPWMVSSVIKEP